MHGHSATSTDAPSLDYLQASPVRGQLEPPDEGSKKTGWRFLQCTDTPNELKVLLPQRTAHIYAQLLKAETSELAKKRNASWERIVEIRHLKERMIRKCHRLAHSYSAQPSTKVSFLSVHAPVDFRLKEMEKWIRLHGQAEEYSKRSSTADSTRVRNSCCDRCANLVPHHHTISRRSSIQSTPSRRSALSDRSTSKSVSASPRRPRSSRASFVHSDHKHSPVASSIVLNESSSSHAARLDDCTVHESNIHFESAENQAHLASTTTLQDTGKNNDASTRQIKHARSMSYDKRSTAERSLHEIKHTMHAIPEVSETSTNLSHRSATEAQHQVLISKLSTTSPEPLPHPYHGSTSAVFLDIVESPVDDPPDVQSFEPVYGRVEDFPEVVKSSPAEDEHDSDLSPRPQTLRRRSSLKRSNTDLRMSMAYSTKSVSWAMDRECADQISKYHAAAGEIEHADREWDAICVTYHEELAGMKALRRNVTQTLDRLRLEAERLHREDQVIHDQEDKLRAGYERLEQKHEHYREKVKAVLQETEHVLTMCGTSRNS